MATGTSKENKRRNSILKDVGELAENENADEKTVGDTRRSIKRVSFADTTSIKMFIASRDANTQWNSTYEEPMNYDSSMEMTTDCYQNVVTETVSYETQGQILMERPNHDAMTMKPEEEKVEDYNQISDFLSTFIGFKPRRSSAGITPDETKLDSSMMDISKTISENLPNFGNESFQDIENVPMDMTCNVEIEPSSKSLVIDNESQVNIISSNANSSKTLNQLNRSSRAISQSFDTDPHESEEYTCMIPCSFDMTCVGDLNVSAFENITLYHQQNDVPNSNNMDSKNLIATTETSLGAMELTGVNKDDSNFSQDMTFTCHGKFNNILSESSLMERATENVSHSVALAAAADSSKARHEMLVESVKTNETQNTEMTMNLTKVCNESIKESISLPASELKPKETTIQLLNEGNKRVNLRSEDDAIDNLNIQTQLSENFDLHSNFKVSPTPSECGGVKNTLKNSMNISVSQKLEANTEKGEREVSCITKSASSLEMSFNDKQTFSKVEKIVVPSTTVNDPVRNGDSEMYSSGIYPHSAHCTTPNMSTNSNVFGSVPIHLLMSSHDESTEIAGLLTSPIINREKRDINISLICGKVSKVASSANVKSRESSDRIVGSEENKNCNTSLGYESESKRKNLRLVTEAKNLSDTSICASPKTETKANSQKTVRETETILARDENDPILQDEQIETDCQNVSVEVNDLQDIVHKESIEIEDSIDCQNISVNSKFHCVLKLDEFGCISQQNIAVSNVENDLNLPERENSESVEQFYISKDEFDVECAQKRKRTDCDATDEPNIKIRLSQMDLNEEAENEERQKFESEKTVHSICAADISEENCSLKSNEEELLCDINIELVDKNKSDTLHTHYSIDNGNCYSPNKSINEDSQNVVSSFEEYNKELSQFLSLRSCINKKPPSPLRDTSLKENNCFVADDKIDDGTQDNFVQKDRENVLSVTSQPQIIPDGDPEDGMFKDFFGFCLTEEESETDRECCPIPEREQSIHQEHPSETVLVKTLIYSELKTAEAPVPVHDNLKIISESCKVCQGIISGSQGISGFEVKVDEGWMELKLQRRPLKIFLDLVHHENHQMVVRADWAPGLNDLKNPSARLAVKYLGHLISEAVENLNGHYLCAIEEYVREVTVAYGKVISFLKEITYIQSCYITEFSEDGLIVVVSSVKAHLSVTLDVKFSPPISKNSSYPRVRIEPCITIGTLRLKTLQDTLDRSSDQDKLAQTIKSVNDLCHRLYK